MAGNYLNMPASSGAGKSFVDTANKKIGKATGEYEDEDEMEFDTSGGGEPMLRDPNASKLPTGKELVEQGMAEVGEAMDEMEQNPPTNVRNPDNKKTPPVAEPVYDQALVTNLFKTTHGSTFDPKSKADVKAMAEIEMLLDEMGGKLGKVTPNQFALQIYRKFRYL